MQDFDELLADLLEEPEEVLGILADIVNRGRLQAEYLPQETVGILSDYNLVVFLVQRAPRQPLRTWVFPSPLGLRVFATLEREAEKVEAEERRRPRASSRSRAGRRGGASTGVSR